MSAASDLASLRAMGSPLVTTRDAAVRLGLTTSAASHVLRRLSDAGVVYPIRRALWAIEPDLDPMQLVPWMTAPYPSYVSLWSALHAHGMLSQIPRETHVVSIGRAQEVSTPLGALVIYHVAPEVFGGYTTSTDGIALATPAKACFDLAYLSATHGRRFRRPPEIRLGRAYRGRDVRSWIERIPSARLRSITLERIEALESDAAASSTG